MSILEWDADGCVLVGEALALVGDAAVFVFVALDATFFPTSSSDTEGVFASGVVAAIDVLRTLKGTKPPCPALCLCQAGPFALRDGAGEGAIFRIATREPNIDVVDFWPSRLDRDAIA